MFRTCVNLSLMLHMYFNPFSSVSILKIIYVATILERSEPNSMILRHSGVISDCNRNETTVGQSDFLNEKN